MIRKLAPVAALALAFPVPGFALAADPAPSADSSGARTGQASRNADKEDMGDPTRIICRKVQQIGTRLGSKRICATAAQWAAIRQEDREGLEKLQTQRFPGNGT